MVLILTACSNNPKPIEKEKVYLDREVEKEVYIKCKVEKTECEKLSGTILQKLSQALECISMRNKDIDIYNENAKQCKSTKNSRF